MDSPLVQLKKYLHILYCRRHIFLLVAATTALLLVVGCFLVPKKYEAASTVFIEGNVLNKLLKGLTVSPSMNDRIRVLRYQMLSRDIVSRVLKNLDKDVQAETPTAFESLVKYCQKHTKINMKGKDLFFVSYVDTDPQFAKDYINTLVNTYVEENISAKRKESFGAGRFLSEQVDFYKQKLDKLEAKIYNYRRKTGIFSTVTEESILNDIKGNSADLKDLLLDKKEQVATVATIKNQLQQMKTKANSAAAGSAADGVMVADSSNPDTQIGALRNKLQSMLLVYNDRYPGIINLKDQIAELEKQNVAQPKHDGSGATANYNPIKNPIFVDLKMRLNAAQADLTALQSREAELQDQGAASKRMLENFPKDKKILADMERERAMNKHVYETLLARVGVAQVSKQMEVDDKTTTFRIIDPAILPTLPVGTKRLIKMLLGLCVGIGAGAGAVVAREKLDDTVKGADQLRDMGLSVLAEIPLMCNEEQEQKTRKIDHLVYAYSACCCLLLAIMLGHDLLGMTFIDRFVANTHLNAFVVDFMKKLR